MRSYISCSFNRLVAVLLGAVCAAGLSGSTAQGGPLAYGLTENDGLVSFDVDNPLRLIDSVYDLSIDGTIGIDFRRATERVVIVSMGGLNGREPDFYEVTNVPRFGHYERLASGPDVIRANPADTTNPYDPVTGVRGTRFGVDFDDVRDQVYIVSNSRNVYTVSFEPATFGLVTTGPELFYEAGDTWAGMSPNVVHIASAGPRLYGIDSGLTTLVTVDPETGGVRTIGHFGPQITSLGGFDILQTPTGYEGFLVSQLEGDGLSRFYYNVDLNSGTISGGVPINGGELYDGLTVPEPSSAMVVCLAGLFALGRRRR